ncbi:hypothetical protein V6Z11_D07G117100 [Gossypium hirsutum]
MGLPYCGILVVIVWVLRLSFLGAGLFGSVFASNPKQVCPQNVKNLSFGESQKNIV